MSKLTKAQARGHRQAQQILAQDRLSMDDKVFVLDNWREDAEHINGAAGAFFTPWGLALDMALHVVGSRVIDLCAGIGTLTLAYWQRCEMDRLEGLELDLVCVESNPDYVAVGRKMVPQATWICADALSLPDLGRFDTAISRSRIGSLAERSPVGDPPEESGDAHRAEGTSDCRSRRPIRRDLEPSGGKGHRLHRAQGRLQTLSPNAITGAFE